MALPKRAAPTSAAAPPPDGWIDPEFKADFPSLFAFIHDRNYDDGSARLTGGISFYNKAGMLTASVNDNDRGLVAYVSAATWLELIFKINEGICDDSLDWKAKQPFSQPRSGGNGQVIPF